MEQNSCLEPMLAGTLDQDLPKHLAAGQVVPDKSNI